MSGSSFGMQLGSTSTSSGHGMASMQAAARAWQPGRWLTRNTGHLRQLSHACCHAAAQGARRRRLHRLLHGRRAGLEAAPSARALGCGRCRAVPVAFDELRGPLAAAARPEASAGTAAAAYPASGATPALGGAPAGGTKAAARAATADPAGTATPAGLGTLLHVAGGALAASQQVLSRHRLQQGAEQGSAGHLAGQLLVAAPAAALRQLAAHLAEQPGGDCGSGDGQGKREGQLRSRAA